MGQDGNFNHRTRSEEGPAMKVTTLGIDLAKNIFRLHGVDGRGTVVLRRQSLAGSCYRSWRTNDHV
jgi:hypothetical protein